MDFGLLRAAWEWAQTQEAANSATVIAALSIPAGVIAYLIDQRQQALSRLQEIDQDLWEEYNDIIDAFIEHPELDQHDERLQNTQESRQQIRIYEKIISAFEKSFIDIYGFRNKEARRIWNSWEGDIDYWLEKPNFRAALPVLLKREDKKFIAYINQRVLSSEGQNPSLFPVPG